MSKVIGAGFDFSESLAFIPPTTTGFEILSGTTPGVFPAWTEISADIGGDDIYLEHLTVFIVDTVKARLQIGIGSGGSEVVITDTMIRVVAAEDSAKISALAKVKVPAGSRLAIRVDDNSGSANQYNGWVHHSKR